MENKYAWEVVVHSWPPLVGMYKYVLSRQTAKTTYVISHGKEVALPRRESVVVFTDEAEFEKFAKSQLGETIKRLESQLDRFRCILRNFPDMIHEQDPNPLPLPDHIELD